MSISWRKLNVVLGIANLAMALLPPYGALATFLHVAAVAIAASSHLGWLSPRRLAVPAGYVRNRASELVPAPLILPPPPPPPQSGSSLNYGNWERLAKTDPAYIYGRLDAITELEHDGTEELPAIAPLGEDPNHCARCREVSETRARQAACSHPEDDIERVEITTFGQAGRRYMTWCGPCGKPMEDT